jgi:hypothetical protein
MTGGPGPASQRSGRWRWGEKAKSEPPEPWDGLEYDKNLNRLARGAWAEDGPLEDPDKGEKSSLPLYGGSGLSTRRNAGIWPHLRVHPSPKVGPGASVGTYGQGYLLLGCPAP